jgi:acetyl-CoA carboxylase carboxyl transferase subunit alpha
MPTFLEFEKPIAELEGKIEELRHLDAGGDVSIADDISKLETKVNRLLKDTYGKLTPWQKVQVARHPERPHFVDYIDGLVEDFTVLAGDRAFAEDAAIVGGFGRFRGRSVVVVGNEKGQDTESRIKHNFGMARPEGYRKARRLFQLADQFHLPVITLVDTAGAYPGVGAEERGQAEAIARSIQSCLGLRVPIVSVVIGEGGSGGAIALAAADRVLMLEHAVYSVISPEGCASILWRTNEAAKEAAEALRLTADDLKKLRVIDAVIEEPVGGAHRNRREAIRRVGDAIADNLEQLVSVEGGALRARRREKFIEMGKVGLH